MSSTILSSEIDLSAIEAKLSAEVVQAMDAIEVFDCIRSTQDYVKNQVPANRLCVAERQVAGKGRRGREWVAAKQGDILLSLSWVYDSVPDALTGLSLAIVAEVAELLVVDYDVPVTIKWPNDLLLLGAKLAGFIVDLETGGRCRVTIGMGMNVANRDDDALAAIDQPIAALFNEGVDHIDRNQLIAEVVERLVRLLMVYPETGFAVYKAKWELYAAHIGENVMLQKRGELENKVVMVGVLDGVDEQGCLCVREPSGVVHKIVDSELSLRLA